MKESDASWDTVGFVLRTACNSQADWDVYYRKSRLLEGGENLRINIEYSIAPVTEKQQEACEKKRGSRDQSGIAF